MHGGFYRETNMCPKVKYEGDNMTFARAYNDFKHLHKDWFEVEFIPVLLVI